MEIISLLLSSLFPAELTLKYNSRQLTSTVHRIEGEVNAVYFKFAIKTMSNLSLRWRVRKKEGLKEIG